METLAAQLLGPQVPFETFAEQVADLLRAAQGNGEARYAERIRFKSTPHFLSELEEYARQISHRKVRARPVSLGGQVIPADWIAARFGACGSLPFAQQINEVTEALVDWMRTRHQVAITGRERTALRSQLKKMVGNTDLHALYENFFVWLDRPDLFHHRKNTPYEYADVFPLIYLKLLLEGVPPRHQVKHLVIDEMQDYTPVQYRVLARLFPCRKTILGDAHQSVNPLSASSAETIREVLPGSECLYMNRSYRSTVEIMELAQTIQRNPHLVPLERHGERPQMVACHDAEEELSQVRRGLEAFLASAHHSLGILCKTQDQADSLYAKLHGVEGGIHLLHARSNTFRSGVIVATAHLAKGLEFDQVIVPFCSEDNYHTLIDRHMLYVACTRAMHRLLLTYTSRPSPFLEAALP